MRRPPIATAPPPPGRRRRAPITPAVLLVLAGAGPAATQAAPPDLPAPGDSIRVTIGGQADVYELVRTEPDSLVLRLADRSMKVSTADLERVQRRVPVPRARTIASSTLKAGLLGALAGAQGGFMAWAFQDAGTYYPCGSTREECITDYALAGGIAGLATGFIRGVLSDREWEWVPAEPTRAGLRIGPRRLSVGVASVPRGARVTIRWSLP